MENRIEIINDITYLEIIEDKTTIEIVEEVVDIVNVAMQGPPGPGVPIGGETDQILTKKSNSDYDFQWMDRTTHIIKTLSGGTTAGADLTLQSTTHATKGSIIIPEFNSSGFVKNDASGNITGGNVLAASDVPAHASLTSLYGDADKTHYGHVQIGDGIAVSAGVISVDVGTGLTLSGTSPNKKIGIDSTVVTLTGTQTLSNKTLSAPKFINTGYIADANGNEEIIFLTTTDAVNELTIANAITGAGPTISSSGADTDIDLILSPKGTGKVKIGSSAVGNEIVTLDGIQTLSNKTLTTPRFADLGYIADPSGNELLLFDSIGSATNYIQISNSTTTNAPVISADGSDTNINLNLLAKGTGVVQVNNDTITTLTAIQTLTNKTLTTPTIASFINANHQHQNSAGGGKLDHGLALNGLTDDDHIQYLLLAGRSGGQTIIGGTASGDDLTFSTTSNTTKGSYFFPDLTASKVVKTSATGALVASAIVASDLDGTFLSTDSTLGGDSSSDTKISSQKATKTYVDNAITALSYEPVLTKGNLTESTSSVLTISGGTGSVIGSGTTIQVKQASSTVSGYLSSTDWSTFNNKSDAHTHPYLSNSTTSTQNGYFGNINLYDDSTPSHYLSITNASNLTATRTLSIITGDADRSLTLSANVTLAHDTHALNADNQTITSGNGMNFTSGSGNVTVTMGTPDSITSTSTNSVTSTSHTHAITGFSLDGHTHSYAPNAFSTIAVSGQSNVVADSTADTLTFIAGTNVTLTTNATNDSVTINSVHPTITAATSVNNSGRTYIQDITLDSNGHITGLASATEADQNTFSNIHALNSSGTDVTNSPYTATTSTSSLNLKAGTGITLAMDTGGIITITGSTTYTHPTYTTRSISLDTSGVDVLDTLTFTSDANGHVTAASGATRTLPSASTSVTGVLTSADWNTFSGKMDATASTTAGYVPVWGANGKTLGTGYSVETTMTGSSSALVRADAVKTYIDGVIATADALVYKGVINCSTNPNYPAGDKGHVYKVSVAGKIGGASGITVEAGDMVICNTDSTASGDQATVGSKWDIIQNNIDLSTLQPKDADLTAIAGLTGTGFAVRTASDTWANRTITAGTGISITNGDGISGNVTVAHTDTSTQATVTNTGRTYIQSITLDGMGHVTGLASATETVTDTNTTYTIKASSQTGGAGLDLDAGGSGSGTDTVKFISGTNVTVAYTDANTITISSTHPDITPASSVNNSGRTYIQDITLDADGHVTGLASATETVTDTNYYPTTYAWSNGTTAGPTGSLTGTGMSAVSFGAIPSASGTVSGIVTTGDQTFAGTKTFTSNIVGNVTGNVSGSSGSCTGNAATATKLSSITTTFTGTYPLTVNVNGVIYSHTGITYSGSGNTLTAGTFSGALSGNASSATISTTSTTTEDTTNELIVVGVTSGATTTLKRDTNVTVTNDSIKANNFKMGTSAYMTYNSSSECIEFIFN